MSKKSETKNNTLGTIAAVKTVLESYPTLITYNTTGNETDYSLSFMMDILRMLGVTKDGLIIWMSKLLTDKNGTGDGILSVIEAGIKTVLLSSIKNTYTCYIDPFLPDNCMRQIYGDSAGIYSKGIEISLEQIDAFGVLNECPTDKGGMGQYLYFDNENYTPTTIYQSNDFNAYLWYVINKGTPTSHECVWDNRNKHRNYFEENLNAKSSFINTKCPNVISYTVSAGTRKFIKQEYIYCQYEEHAENANPNTLRVWLNFDRYHNDVKNKTLFEFNFDYINSLKLFDSKVLIAQIVNAMLGISSSLKGTFSVERTALQGKISEIVKRIIMEEDSEITDCFFTFDNAEYDSLITKALQKYNGKYATSSGEESFSAEQLNKIMESLNTMNEGASQSGRTETIAKVFTDISATLAESPSVETKNKYSLELGIIHDFINETVTEIALQVLSPKVMILFAINNAVMHPDAKLFSLEDFMTNFWNIITNVIKQIVETILKELLEYILSILKPLIVLFVEKLLLETLMYYIELLKSLLSFCSLGDANAAMRALGFEYNNLIIDNVNYADIVPVQSAPPKNC